MNRVMRVLAVVSVLGLIPAVVGGLLGMNLADNPWPVTLPQVTFAGVLCHGDQPLFLRRERLAALIRAYLPSRLRASSISSCSKALA